MQNHACHADTVATKFVTKNCPEQIKGLIANTGRTRS